MPSPVFLAWEQKLAAEISAKKGFWAGFVFMATCLEMDWHLSMQHDRLIAMPAWILQGHFEG